MSFFLFCCLVLIILQAPLGLNNFGGTSTVFGLPALPWGSSPIGGFGGVNLGGMPGCTGMVAGYVPWCPPSMPGPGMAYAHQMPMAPPQMLYSNPAPQVVVEASPHRYQREHQMGGQGQIATSGGGAGWSWYANPDGSDGGELQQD